MPLITALLHTHNDALRLGRCLETLYPCDEILVVDHDSADSTLRAAREYGVKILANPSAVGLSMKTPRWLLCLEPHESLSESLAASLYEWKSQSIPADAVFSVAIREETSAGWLDLPEPQTRLVPATWNRWQEFLPAHDPKALRLDGSLLRFAYP
jgi:hypothetical protein